ncbi:anti-repressor SinI family protein [Cytobacillus solani]|nr:anti-repressor SinI family protein [Cytobacillus solani]USK55818.1 anti-repressor SinI family protein [Cytobacillus solani]
MVEVKVTVGEMDTEWLELIIEAKKMGIKQDEIREFFMNSGVTEIVLKG